MTERKKVAIIGSGTGLTLAFLLLDHFDVTIFEASDRLGGHINSIEIKCNDGSNAIVEGGAEFLDSTYLHFFRLLDYLKVEKRKYTMTLEFINQVTKERIYFSPDLSDTAKNFDGLGEAFEKEGIKGLMKEMVEDSDKISHLINLKLVIEYFKCNKKKIPKTVTLEELLKSIGKEKFGEEFLYHVVASSWGVSSDDAKTFLAYCALNYLSVKPEFYEVIGGLSKYIKALEEKIKNKCEILLNHEVKSIHRTGDKFIVGGISDFDEVVLCTNAEISAKLISSIPELIDLKAVLNTLKYYDTTVCFHEAPSDNTFNKNIVVHMEYDGKRTCTSVLKKWNSNVTKKWVFNDEYPKDVYVVRQYRHPHMDLPYYQVQEALKKQNELSNGVSFGSILGGLCDRYQSGADSHESGIMASVNIADNLFKKYNIPRSDELKLFDGITDVDECCFCC
jgi:predicted NAD/FAD-binding protein